MANAYIKGNFTLPAGSSVNLASNMVTEGYSGTMLGKYLRGWPNALTDVFVGDASTVNATTGVPMTTANPLLRQGTKEAAIDAGRFWFFSATGGDISIHFEAL